MSLFGLFKGKRLEFLLVGVVCIVAGVLVARFLWFRPVSPLFLLNSYHELDLDSGEEKLVFVWGFNNTVTVDQVNIFYKNGTVDRLLNSSNVHHVTFYVGDTLSLHVAITDTPVKDLDGEFSFHFLCSTDSFRYGCPVPFATQNVHGGNQK